MVPARPGRERARPPGSPGKRPLRPRAKERPNLPDRAGHPLLDRGARPDLPLRPEGALLLFSRFPPGSARGTGRIGKGTGARPEDPGRLPIRARPVAGEPAKVRTVGRDSPGGG